MKPPARSVASLISARLIVHSYRDVYIRGIDFDEEMVFTPSRLAVSLNLDLQRVLTCLVGISSRRTLFRHLGQYMGTRV